MISDAANTEKPSSISGSLFIGGSLAARSVYTLQHLGITHILCLCSNEIGQSDSQYPDLFEYRNFSVSEFSLYFAPGVGLFFCRVKFMGLLFVLLLDINLNCTWMHACLSSSKAIQNHEWLDIGTIYQDPCLSVRAC